MASIRQRRAGTWQLRAENPHAPTGTRQQCQKTITVTDPALLRSKKQLDRYLREQLVQFEQELRDNANPKPTHNAPAGQVPDAPVTVADFAARWLREHVELNLELNSQLNYKHFIHRRIVPALGHLPLAQVQPHHLTAMLAQLRQPNASLKGGRLGDASVLYCYRVLRSLFATATGWQLIEKNPMAGILKPRERQRKPDVSFYEEHELEQLGAALQTARAELRAMVLLGVSAGLRRGEIAGLQWRHIDFAGGTLSIQQSLPKYFAGQPHIKSPKTASSRRRITMPQLLREALAAHKATQHESMYRPGAESRAPDDWSGPHDFLFCHPSGRPVDPQRLTKWWQEFHRANGLRPIRLHDLRHTAAAWLIRSNQHPKTVAGMLGHAQIKTSMDTYGHLMASLYPQAAAAMDTLPLGSPPTAQRKYNTSAAAAGATLEPVPAR